ncbi:MAG: hypothetical protein JO108_27870 [Acidobacteriaceae bacterium]|nr:hypothetical protein [Acidobacteriaceae bacterium]
MRISNRLQSVIALICAGMLTVPPVQARTRKGDRYLKLGAKAEAQKDYDAALTYYDDAISTDPNEPAYLLAEQNVRGKAAEAHLSEAKTLLSEHKLDEALAQYQRAFVIEPSSQIALQGIQEVTLMIKERNGAPPGTTILTPAQQAREEMEKRINSLEGPPVLRPINAEISSLKMNNQPARVLYESVGKLAGINVLFDPTGIEAGAAKNFNLDLTNLTLEEALNYISLETHTFWKPISHNAIFVTQESDPKRQEYQDEVVRVFYIQNAGTAAEFTEIFNAVRTGAKLTTGIFSVPSQNAIVARGSADTMQLVEKLVHDLDRPKAEVVIDVIVMQVNRTLEHNIGASLLGQGGLSVPFVFTPRNPTTTSGSGSSSSGSGSTGSGSSGSGSTGSTSSSSLITIARAGHLSSADYSISLPSTVVQALMSDARTHILQRPQVRATDGGKASLKIGSRIPYVSGSLNSAVATPGSIPYATTQFQQVDVGTQIDFQPHVNGPEDISMHLKVELSTVLQTVLIAGVQEPVIGQQVDEADIRMKDGEVSLLGGLSDKEKSDTIGGLPGVTNLPILGYLFGNKDVKTTDNELLIALIPHVVRAPDLTAAGGTGVLAGTERVVRVERRPQQAATQTGQPSTVPVPPAQPLSPAPHTPQPQPPVAPVNQPQSPPRPAGAPPQGVSPQRGTPPVGSPQNTAPPHPASTPTSSPPQASNQ